MNVTDLPSDILVIIIKLLTPREAHRLATLHSSLSRALAKTVSLDTEFALQSARLMVPKLHLSYDSAKRYAKLASYCRFFHGDFWTANLFNLFQSTINAVNPDTRTWQELEYESAGLLSERAYRQAFEHLPDIPYQIRNWVNEANAEPKIDLDDPERESLEEYEDYRNIHKWTQMRLSQLAIVMANYVNTRLFPSRHGPAI